MRRVRGCWWWWWWWCMSVWLYTFNRSHAIHSRFNALWLPQLGTQIHWVTHYQFSMKYALSDGAGTSNVGPILNTYMHGIACMHTSIINLTFSAHEMTWMEEDIRPLKYCNRMFFILFFVVSQRRENQPKNDKRRNTNACSPSYTQIYRFVHLTLSCAQWFYSYVFVEVKKNSKFPYRYSDIVEYVSTSFIDQWNDWKTFRTFL